MHSHLNVTMGRYVVHTGYEPVSIPKLMFVPTVTQAETQLLLYLYIVSRNIILF